MVEAEGEGVVGEGSEVGEARVLLEAAASDSVRFGSPLPAPEVAVIAAAVATSPLASVAETVVVISMGTPAALGSPPPVGAKLVVVSIALVDNNVSKALVSWPSIPVGIDVVGATL